jgi:acyl-CoA synthetase (NDP forming)
MANDMTNGPRVNVERLIKPRSVAIIGVSSKPGTAGQIVLSNLVMNGYSGDIHIVGRGGGEIDGRRILGSVDDVPEGVDLAVFTLPAAGVAEALAGCVRRRVGAAVVFASGFAETGAQAEQDALSATARDAGIALLGPNCLGFTNALDGLRINFAGAGKINPIDVARDPCAAIISQSGGLLAHIRAGLEARDIPVPYSVSTGNEAGIGLAELIRFFADDPVVRSIVLYVEQVRNPSAFLAAAARARAVGKPVIMMHPGRGERAKSALQSHTGSLAGDYQVMRTLVTHGGIALIDTLDELVDTAELLTRYPTPPVKGPGIVTLSGAYCALAHDFADDLGLDLPEIAPETEAALKRELPPFASPRNPLDLTTAPVFQPDLMRIGAQTLLADDNVGSLLMSISLGSPAMGLKFVTALIAGIEGSTKPTVLAVLGDRAPVAPEVLSLARERRLMLSTSTDRSLRALARATAYGQALRRADRARQPEPLAGLPKLAPGTQSEWRSKELLAAAGLRVPEGALAASADEAVAVAARIGYPVAMKAQAAALAHKTEAGAVALGIADAASVRRAWETLTTNVGKAQPGLELDGVLVERVADKGLELVVGARRDPKWGPVVLVGLGGIWVEALNDVRLLPPDLCHDDIVAELGKLRTAKLLHGFRGAPPVDVDAVARVVSRVGALMLAAPDIAEIDINPLFAHAAGQGATIVDALIVSNEA